VLLGLSRGRTDLQFIQCGGQGQQSSWLGYSRGRTDLQFIQ
jgi:hypothetical protein